MSHYGPGAASTSSRDLGPPPNGATASRYGRDSGPSAYGGRGGSGAGGNGSRNFQAADNRKLFVASLSYDTTAEVLQRLFASVGKVSDCRIAKDRESGESRGFAFVTMERESDALLALEEFNGHELDGREIKVNMANAEGGSGGRKKEEPAKGHGPGEEVNVTAYKAEKIQKAHERVVLKGSRLPTEMVKATGHDFVYSGDEDESADPEGAFVNSLSMEEKRQLLRTLSGKQDGGADSMRKKGKKDKKSKKDAKESKRHKKEKKKKKKRSRSSDSSSSSDSEINSDSKRRKRT